MRRLMRASSWLMAVLWLSCACASIPGGRPAPAASLTPVLSATTQTPEPGAVFPTVLSTPRAFETAAPTMTVTPAPTRTPTAAPSSTATIAPIQMDRLPFIGLANISRLALLTIIPQAGQENGLPGNFAFSPDSRSLALDAGREVWVWDIRQGTERSIYMPPPGVTAPGVMLSFSRDGQVLARIYGLNQIVIWEMETGQVVREVAGRSPDEVFTMLAFGAPGTGASLITSGMSGGDPRVTFWDWNTGSVLAESTSSAQQVDGFVVSPNGRLVLQAGHDGTLRFWNPQTGKLLGQQILYACPDSLVHAIYSQDGQLFAVQCDGGENAQAKSRIFIYWPNYYRPENLILAGVLDNEHTGSGLMAFNRYDELLALVDGAQWNQVTLWGVASRAASRTLNFEFAVRQLAFSPDGRLLAVQLSDGSIELWGIK